MIAERDLSVMKTRGFATQMPTGSLSGRRSSVSELSITPNERRLLRRAELAAQLCRWPVARDAAGPQHRRTLARSAQ